MRPRCALGLLSLLIAVLLSACQAVVPAIRTAEIQTHDEPQRPGTYSLSPEQVDELNAWFQARREGWSTSLASHVPKLIVRAKHSDGTETVVNVLRSSVVIYSSSPKLTNQLVRNLTTSEQQVLQQLLLRR